MGVWSMKVASSTSRAIERLVRWMSRQLNCPAARRWVIPILALPLILAVGIAEAEEPGGLVPLFGNGQLTIQGSGFQPKEVVTVIAEVAAVSRRFTVTADAQGGFQVVTGLAVRPGASVKLEARGEQGTNLAVMTSVPPARIGAPIPNLPRAGGTPVLIAIGAALGLFLGGVAACRAGRCGS